MKLAKETNPKKAKIQKIAAAGMGTLFLILLVKTVAFQDGGPATPKKAAARSRPARDVAVSSAAEVPGPEPAAVPERRWEEVDAPAFVRQRLIADSSECLIPPNPFRVSTRLKEDITGVKRTTSKPSSQPPRKKRIEVKLKGIVADHSSGERIALIDDELLRKGDQYRGFTVVEIGSASVTLDDGEERRVVCLEEK